MDPDLFLVIGLTLGALTIPSMISAFSENRPPRTAAVVMLVAGILIVLALQDHKTGYKISELPNVFYRVIARYAN